MKRTNKIDLLLIASFKQGNTWLAPNVEIFLDSISQYTGIATNCPDEEECINLIRNAAHELHRFQKGERRYYPEKEVKEALDILGEELGKGYNHTDLADLYVELYYWYCFASQAALLCPNVEFICDYHSEDHQIGLWNEKCSWYYPMMSWLLVQHDNYCTIHLIDYDTHLDKVFQINDDCGRDYYLITNGWGRAFGAYLYEQKSDEVVFVASVDKINYPDHEYWVKIEGTQSLYLHLDADVPYFETH